LLAHSAAAKAQKPSARQNSGVPEQRLAHLQHGINLSNWFAQLQDPAAYTKEHFEKSVTPDDIALIRAMGFDHVRLSVDPRSMFHAAQSEKIASDDLTNLDAAMKMILDQGLAVDLSIYADEDFKQTLAGNDDAVERFADFWRALAQHYANLDPDRVFFEILNEPEGRDRYRWYGVEAKLAAAIREGAPQHTIIATGAHWSDDDDLVFLEPLRDPNVIYAFHFYESHIFTHQGANWSVNYWHYLRGVPYPADLERAKKAAELVPDPVHRLEVIRYGLDNWNAARIDAEIGQVDEWAQHWNVPVICNEFGVYRKYADPKDRAAWITDVRTALEKRRIGWAMWDYSSTFGVVTKQQGQTQPDAAILQALGRAVPTAAPTPATTSAPAQTAAPAAARASK
jgi:aryl-phospho-beta-D-glucosidase BglC (GH1 family)